MPKKAQAARVGDRPTPGYNDVEYLVVDVSHLAFRHAHAMERMTTQDGRRSGHVYGCFKHLRALVTAYAPKHVVFVYDRGAPWRKQLVPDYKATRRIGGAAHVPGPPDDGLYVIPEGQPSNWTPGPDVERLFRALPGHHLALEDFEADDMVAWFVEQSPLEGAPAGLEPRKHAIAIYSGDRDLWQLVNDESRVGAVISKKLGKGKSFNAWVCEPQVEETFGCRPMYLARIKALLGDDSDNIRGLDGGSRPGKKEALRTFATCSVASDYFDASKPCPDLTVAPDWLRDSLKTQRDRMLANVQVTDLKQAVARIGSHSPIETVREGKSAPALGVLVEYECDSLLPQVEPLLRQLVRNATQPRIFG